METVIQEQGAQLRCYACGSPAVEWVCHHCGRPMCRQHGPAQPRLHGLTENREFAGLTLQVWPFHNQQPVHCAPCLHNRPNYRRIMLAPGLVILAVGMILLATAVGSGLLCLIRPAPVSPQPTASLGLSEVLRDPAVYATLPMGYCYLPPWENDWAHVLQMWLVVMIGLGTASCGYYLAHRRPPDTASFAPGMILAGEHVAANTSGCPPVPLAPVSTGMTVCEFLTAHLTLDAEGRSTVMLTGPLRGEIDPHLHFTDMDRQRIKEYQTILGHDKANDFIFQAGYLALLGRPLLRFAMRPTRRTIFWLGGPVSAYPGLLDNRADTSLPMRWEYTVPADDAELLVPVRLLPALVAMSDLYSLRLLVQFNAAAFPFLRAGQTLDFESVQLELAHAQWSYPDTSGLVTSDAERGLWCVEWRHLQFPAAAGFSQWEWPTLHFNRPLAPDAHLTGKLRLRVPALYSGLNGIACFSALGHRIPAAFHGETCLEIEFELSLARLPYAELVTRTWEVEFTRELTPARVQHLLDMLNSEPDSGGPALGMGVLHVEEQAPGNISPHGGPRWDIWGRRYRHTLPVDFHLGLYGNHAALPTSRVDITIQGQVFDSHSWRALDETSNHVQFIITQEALG